MEKRNQQELLTDYLKQLIDEKGMKVLSKDPWTVYTGLCMQEDIQPLYARGLLMTLLAEVPLQASKIKKADLEAFIRENTGLNEALTAEMAKVYASLFSGKNKKEWKENKLKGFKEFCEKEWVITWNGCCEWNTGTVRMECMAEAWIEVRVASEETVQKENRKLLKENPFVTAEQIFSLYQEQIRTALDADFKGYCTEDDYYEPVVEDYAENFYDLAEAFLVKHGFAIEGWDYKGSDGGFEPIHSRYW